MLGEGADEGRVCVSESLRYWREALGEQEVTTVLQEAGTVETAVAMSSKGCFEGVWLPKELYH